MQPKTDAWPPFSSFLPPSSRGEGKDGSFDFLPLVSENVGSFTPSELGGLLAEYDMLKGGAESATILYDRKPGGGANGTVEALATYSAVGLTTGSGVGARWATTGVAESAVGTLLIYYTPSHVSAGPPVFASSDLTGGITPQYLDMSGNVAIGQITPRFRDLVRGTGQVATGMAAPSWPFTLGTTYGNPMNTSINGVNAVVYDSGTRENGLLTTKSFNVRLGNNFANNGTSPNVYHYVLIFSGVLTESQVRQCHNYMVSRCSSRGIVVGGPAVLTGNLLTLSGNSITALINENRILPTLPFDKAKAGLSGAGPAQWLALAGQSAVPLRRPNSPRNYAFLWPTAIGSLADIQQYIPPYSAALKAAGWRPIVATSISASGGYDVTKNQLNSWLDSPQGWVAWADALCDFRDILEISADGAFANLTYFLDGIHPTDIASYRDLIEPRITSVINLMAA